MDLPLDVNDENSIEQKRDPSNKRARVYYCDCDSIDKRSIGGMDRHVQVKLSFKVKKRRWGREEFLRKETARSFFFRLVRQRRNRFLRK